jgi:hypothetical protein
MDDQEIEFRFLDKWRICKSLVGFATVKVKVALPLCIITHHAMKTYGGIEV